VVLGCRVGDKVASLSFLSICRRVVFPALSRPRKRSLACLLRRPKDARTSQNQLHSKISSLQHKMEILVSLLLGSWDSYFMMNIFGDEVTTW
jgi:hypothetical protein